MHYVVNDVASTGTLCGGWMTWRAPIHYVVNGVASTGTLRGGWMTRRAPVHYAVDAAASTGSPVLYAVDDAAGTGTLFRPTPRNRGCVTLATCMMAPVGACTMT